MTNGTDRDGSVTRWIGGLKEGEREAMDQLWSRYFERLTALAKRRLRGSSRASLAADEEDIALSALNSLWAKASGGQLPELRGRDELWRLLVVITARKAVRQIAREGRRKRGGGRVLGEDVLAAISTWNDASGTQGALAQLAGAEPTPEFVIMVAEETARLLDKLPDPTLQRVAVLRMEGHTNQEIAVQVGCVVRTVERKLDLIRKLWGEEESE